MYLSIHVSIHPLFQYSLDGYCVLGTLMYYYIYDRTIML